MSGLGSGERKAKKPTVERALTIGMDLLRKAGMLPGSGQGEVRFRRADGNESTLGISVETRGHKPHMRLFYRATRRFGSERSFDYKIGLDKLPCRFGGWQWYFRCRNCDRRVRHVHLPKGANVFACRRCHSMTYRSVQTHDKRVAYLRDHPDALSQLIADGSADIAVGSSDTLSRGMGKLRLASKALRSPW